MDSTATRGRPRDADRDDLIMDAAVRLVAEHGFEATSVDAIASAAGVGKATVYRRWAGKTELVLATLHRQHTPGEVPDDTGGLRGDLMAMLAADLVVLERDARLVAGVVFAMRSRPKLRELITEFARREITRRVATVLDRARARARDESVIAPADPAVELVVEVMRSMLLGRVVYDPRPTGPDFLAALVDGVVLPLVHIREGEQS